MKPAAHLEGRASKFASELIKKGVGQTDEAQGMLQSNS